MVYKSPDVKNVGTKMERAKSDHPDTIRLEIIKALLTAGHLPIAGSVPEEFVDKVETLTKLTRGYFFVARPGDVATRDSAEKSPDKSVAPSNH